MRLWWKSRLCLREGKKCHGGQSPIRRGVIISFIKIESDDSKSDEWQIDKTRWMFLKEWLDAQRSGKKIH